MGFKLHYNYIIETHTIPSTTDTMVAISPGIINEWFSRYLPIRVVPVVSKFMAAITVSDSWAGKNNRSQLGKAR